MPPRQTFPREWLMTDRRLGDRVWQAVHRLPRGSGIVLRHHQSEWEFGQLMASCCKRRELLLAVAGDVEFARRIGALMVHNPASEAEGLLVSRSVHSIEQAKAAADADLFFISPIHATASHPGVNGLGIDAAIALARLAGMPAIALGGMNRTRGEAATAAGFWGWAGVGAWLSDPA